MLLINSNFLIIFLVYLTRNLIVKTKKSFMKTNTINYKNIDKSTNFLLNEIGAFKVFHLSNVTEVTEQLKHSLQNNYIQLYFCLQNTCSVAFNIEHCAINLSEGNSSMVYLKDDKMELLFNIKPNSELLVILISIEYFHSLFSINGNSFFNYNSLKTENPIIEPKEISPSVKLVLNQIISKRQNNALQPIFIKGKIYELMSYYFSNSEENTGEQCPYIPNEDTLNKIKQAKQIILAEMKNPPSLAELAKEVGLNIKKLKTDFREYYGVPVYTYLLNYKMEIAKTLLQENQLNVNEIASYLGYSASTHFIVAFKKKFGITPKQFIK